MQIAWRNHSLKRTALLLVLVFAAAACTLRPPYQEPQPKPAAVTEAQLPYFNAQPYAARWWHQFEDPVLESLETAALESNHDVRIAVARVQQARALFDDASL